MREGINAEKTCNTSKQTPGSTDLAKDVGLPSGEADTTNLLGTPHGLGLQTKKETDNVPSSVNAAKNISIKFGKYHNLFLCLK